MKFTKLSRYLVAGALAFVSIYASAQSYPCVGLNNRVFQGYCCGSPTYYYFQSGGQQYAATQQYQYCCGSYMNVTTLTGYCLNTDLQIPGLLERFQGAEHNGRMLVASCTGKLIPLPQPAIWIPKDLPIHFDHITSPAN